MPLSSDKLTSRERVDRALSRRAHDRVPHHDSYWKETIQRWQSEGLGGTDFMSGFQAALDMLGSDVHSIVGSWPAPFAGRREVVREDESTETISDEWGGIMRYWKGRSGTPEHIGWQCDSRETWEQKFKPVLLSQPRSIDPVGSRQAWETGCRLQRFCTMDTLETFEITRRLLGDEGTLMAMAEEPEWIQDISRTFTDLILRDFEAVLATSAQPDGVWCYGDMAFNHATMCSPAMYRELIWPDHKRLADWAHAHDMKFIFHTDGNVNGVLDLYLAAGFDCLQPLEAKAGMDVRTLAPRYGDRLSFWGNINVMVMGSNDREQIEEEVRTKLEAGKACHGYLYHSDHSVPPQTSWQTYLFIIELLNRYGQYE
jgi:uroporphyrinogen decarboxylase